MAFSVSLGGGETNIGAGVKVEWESVRTNVGGGFNPTTSEFVCPSDGIYFFSVDVLQGYEGIY